MASVAPEYGVKFTLTGPDGTVATFNDLTDGNNVGTLTNIDGLDSAEVRDSGDVITAFDGGMQGANYFGRRPIVLEGVVYGHASAAVRNDKLDRLTRATMAMRSDAILSWTPSGLAAPVSLALRRQLPLRVTGGWNKTFQAGMVASDPRIYGAYRYSPVEGSHLALTPFDLFSFGNSPTYPVVSIYGPVSPFIINAGTSDGVRVEPGVADGQMYQLDLLRRTMMQATQAWRRNLFANPSQQSSGSYLTATASTTATSNVTGPASPLSPFDTAGTTKVATLVSTATPASIGATSPIYTFGGATGAQCSVGWSAASAALPRVMKTKIDFLNSSNVSVGSTTTTGNTTSTSAWTRSSAFFDKPATATKVQITFILQPASGNCVNGETHYIDGIVVNDVDPILPTSPPATTYYDGDTANTATNFYTWEGTAHNSVARETQVAPGGALTSVYAYINGTESNWFALNPGNNTMRITNLSGVAVPNMKVVVTWRDAWL